MPCLRSVGFQWPPAVVKSGASQRPVVWTWVPCVPAGMLLASTVMRMPSATSVAVARPASAPAAVRSMAVAERPSGTGAPVFRSSLQAASVSSSVVVAMESVFILSLPDIVCR